MDLIGLVENEFKKMLSDELGIEEVVRGVDYNVIDKPIQGKYGQYVVFTDVDGKDDLRVLTDIGSWYINNKNEIIRITPETPVEIAADFDEALDKYQIEQEQVKQIFGLN